MKKSIKEKVEKKENKKEEKEVVKEEKKESEEERKEKLLKRIVPSHNKKSREVKDSDIERVIRETQVLHEICFTPNGLYQGAYAMHHSQIDDKDPLNFFVTVERRIIINPEIIRKTEFQVDSKEACMTFPTLEQIIVPRSSKLNLKFKTVIVDPEDKEKFKLSSEIVEEFRGHRAFEVQHETDHGKGKYIYNLKK